MFKEAADIQTADMLNLPVPKAQYHNVSVEASEFQAELVKEFSERAEKVRNRMVDPSVDNMLKITNDGRKLALDQRLINSMLPDDSEGKVAACANNAFEIWEKTADRKSAQLIFCDLSTPKNDGTFNVYNDIKAKLIEKGVPESDIAFIHEADTEAKKSALFAKVRSGDVRILLGSTPKMGAGTNVQERLIASHDLDCPWRPADLEQRSGRIIRQGNTNDEVHIFRYVTKNTFDSYLWQLVENKQKFISQIMTSKSPVRSAEDIDETALSYAEIKALATGNPYITEKMELDTDVARLKMLKSSFMSQKYDLENMVIREYPQQIAALTEQIAGFEQDISTSAGHPKIEDVFNPMTVDGVIYSERDEAGKALIERCKKMTNPRPVQIGNYRGFDMELSFNEFSKTYILSLKGALSHNVELGAVPHGNIIRIDNAIDGMERRKESCVRKLADTKKQLEAAKEECKAEFPREEELKEKLSRLSELDAMLNMDKRENEAVDLDPPDGDEPEKKKHEMER